MNRQEIFDRVARHLLTQNATAMEGLSCVYKTSDGKKCAFGALIPDEFYDPDMEGTGIDSILTDHPPMQEIIDLRVPPYPSSDAWARCDQKDEKVVAWETYQRDLKLLCELQSCHDSQKPEAWPRRLLDIAYEFELSAVVLREFPGRTL